MYPIIMHTQSFILRDIKLSTRCMFELVSQYIIILYPRYIIRVWSHNILHIYVKVRT